jgi:nucleoside-diphosphate-sugar epimerase
VHRGSARSWLHVADAVRAIEAAGRLEQYAVINLGHPDIVPMHELAEMIRAELNASPELVVTTELPPKMTLVKRPTLERQRTLLGFEPEVSLADGIRRLCAIHGRPSGSELSTLAVGGSPAVPRAAAGSLE